MKTEVTVSKSTEMSEFFSKSQVKSINIHNNVYEFEKTIQSDFDKFVFGNPNEKNTTNKTRRKVTQKTSLRKRKLKSARSAKSSLIHKLRKKEGNKHSVVINHKNKFKCKTENLEQHFKQNVSKVSPRIKKTTIRSNIKRLNKNTGLSEVLVSKIPKSDSSGLQIADQINLIDQIKQLRRSTKCRSQNISTVSQSVNSKADNSYKISNLNNSLKKSMSYSGSKSNRFNLIENDIKILINMIKYLAAI